MNKAPEKVVPEKIQKEEQSDLKAALRVTLNLPAVSHITETENIPLALCEGDKTPLEPFIPSQLVSPANFGASIFPYGSPQAQSTMMLPFTGIGADNCNQLIGSPLNCPLTFGSCMEYISMASRRNSENLANPIFTSGKYSPCFPTFSAAMYGIDSSSKCDDNK